LSHYQHCHYRYPLLVRREFLQLVPVPVSAKRHSVVASHFVGVAGVGQFTDIQYQIKSSGHETLVHNDGQEARTVTGTTNLFIEGGGVDSVLHVTAHYTVNPSGQITVDFVNEAGGC
jgi:hypothetical protein